MVTCLVLSHSCRRLRDALQRQRLGFVLWPPDEKNSFPIFTKQLTNNGSFQQIAFPCQRFAVIRCCPTRHIDPRSRTASRNLHVKLSKDIVYHESLLCHHGLEVDHCRRCLYLSRCVCPSNFPVTLVSESFPFSATSQLRGYQRPSF